MRLFSLVIAMIIATLFGCKTHKERNGSPNTNSINNKMSASDSMDPSETKISPWLDPAPIPGVIVPPFFGPGLVGNGGGRSGHKNRDPGYCLLYTSRCV